MSVKAVLISTSGHVEITQIEANRDTLKGIVGGWIESLDLLNGDHAYLNDEGKTLGLPYNHLANTVFHQMNPYLSAGDLIVGDVVLLGDDVEGDEADVSEDTINQVLAWRSLL